MPAIHVVAGILHDAQGRVLLAQRPQGKHLAGTWEFPGGKVEPGETAHAALRRELREELGVEIGAVAPLISIPWRYAQKSIFLDVYNVLDYAGVPHGRETQAIAWHDVEELAGVTMPPPDRPIVTALRLPPCYAITPEPGDDEEFLAEVESALATGIRLLQLRAKHVPIPRLRSLARSVQDLARRRGAQLLLNGHPDVAAECDLDGVHLPAAQLMRCSQRPLPDARWVVASCHDEHEIAHAAAIGVDFAVLGPLKATATHPGAPELGWQRFAELCAMAPFPVYALGGMTRDDVTTAMTAGAQGIAGISAFFSLQ